MFKAKDERLVSGGQDSCSLLVTCGSPLHVTKKK
jgi:hypothetical protein